METRLFDSDAIRANAPMADVVSVVADAFEAYAEGNALMPPKSYVDLPRYNGDFRAMPAYVEAAEWEAAGIKWVNVHPDNPERFGLPTVMGMLIYSDPETAYPLAVMDGTELTMKRTGAAAAVATDRLAIGDANSLGIVGAGAQAYLQLEAIAEVRPIETVVISDLDEARTSRFVEHFAEDFDVRAGSTSEAASCDVVSTVTPVESPVVFRDDVGPNTHVNAVGADASGKQELEEAILRDARLVIDDFEQTTHSGEINVPWERGTLDETDIDAELGAIVSGRVAGREPDDGVTVFDSTGLAIQDVATSHVVYENATESGDGHSFDFVGES